MNHRLAITIALLAAYPIITAAGGGGGCATTAEPKIVTVEVKVPVVAPCPDQRAPAPTFIDSLEAIRAKAAVGSDGLVALLLGGREQRIQHQAESDAQIGACARPPNPG
jgi:hypothetical protein